MLIRSQFTSPCNACNQLMKANTEIQWAKGFGGYHVDCAPDEVVAITGRGSNSRGGFRGRGRSRSAAAAAPKNGTCGKCNAPCNARYELCYKCQHGITAPSSTPDVDSSYEASDTIRDLHVADVDHAAALAAIPF